MSMAIKTTRCLNTKDINYYANNMDTIMLLREIDVTDIPDNLHSEYEWNINQENKM